MTPPRVSATDTMDQKIFFLHIENICDSLHRKIASSVVRPCGCMQTALNLSDEFWPDTNPGPSLGPGPEVLTHDFSINSEL